MYNFFKDKLEVFCKKDVLKSFAKCTGKHLCWSLFISGDFIKKWLQHWCFLVKFANFFRKLILQNTWEQLLLHGFFSRTVSKISNIYKSINASGIYCPYSNFEGMVKRTYCTKFCMPYQWVKGLFRQTSSTEICSKTVKEQRLMKNESYELLQKVINWWRKLQY